MRIIISIIGVIFLLGVLAVGALYVSVESIHAYPEKASVEGLAAPISITWDAHQTPHIDASSPAGRYAALGYLHGLTRTWSVALWRQTALGRLSEWFGEETIMLDRWARQLGWAAQAQMQYQTLGSQQKELLQAYARGMNAALDYRANRTTELLVFDIELEPWQPWHSLAVEQLIAWLGVSDLEAPPQLYDDPLAAQWIRANQRLRRWLHLDSFDLSAVWAIKDSSGTSIALRQVYGSSALPLFQEVAFSEGEHLILAASIPGTTMFPAGKNESYVWMLFLTAPARIEPVPSDSEPPSPRYETINVSGGRERPATIRRSDGWVYLSDEWRLHWSGFETLSDFEVWRAILRGNVEEDFGLIAGNGCLVTRTGDVRILGDPAVVRSFSEGIMVGEHRWTRRVSRRLTSEQTPGASSNVASALPSDVYSPWADSLRRWMIAAVGSSQTWPARSQDAMTYLRNWEGSFRSASIGASIFDMWVAVYRDRTGVLPVVHSQPGASERMLLYITFNEAVERLEARYGSDMSRWRWETVQPNEQYFPVWSTLKPVSDDLEALANGRYGPVSSSSEGHPSTLRWGPSLLLEGQLASAAWESSVSTTSWDRMIVRTSAVPVDGFLKRYWAINQYPAVFTIHAQVSASASHTLTLFPAHSQ